MSSCFVCKRTRNALSRKKCISFHRIPKVHDVYKQWIAFIERSGGDLEKLKPDSVLCSEHFEKKCFLQYFRRRILKENSIPTIIIYLEKSIKKQVPESALNLLPNTKYRVEYTKIPDCSIPVIANDLNLEVGVHALAKDSSFQSSENEHTTFSLNIPKSKSESLSDMEYIDHPDTDECYCHKTNFKRMISSLVNENYQTKKRLKLLNQKLRIQENTINFLKSIIKVLHEKDHAVMNVNKFG